MPESYTDIKLNLYLITKLRAMNKNILGMILVACLLSKSATAMVAVAHARPTVTDTRSTQEIYEYFRAHPGDPLPVECAIARIRNLPDSPYYYARGTDAWHALYYLLPCRSENRKELAQLLVLSGSDLNKMLLVTVGHSSYSPQYRPLIDTLLDIGADANTTDDSGETLLHLASRHSMGVRSLLTHGANPDALDREGFTPLQRAITFSQLETARELLEGGADANIPTPFGNTPLHLALSHEKSLTTALLQHGANPNARDRNLRTPLHQAINGNHGIYSNQIEKAIELVEGNADINLPDRECNTALHLAVMHDGIKSIVNKPLIMSILARANVNILSRNIRGKTPLDIVRDSYYLDDAVKPVDFSSLLSKCVPHSTHYKAVKKFEKTIKKLEAANQAHIDNAKNPPDNLFARLFGTAPAATNPSGSNPASPANPASPEQKETPFLESPEFKAIATILIAGILGKLIHSKLISLGHERALQAMTTTHSILETKSPLNKSLEAFSTTLGQTANVSTLANELERLFELSELKALNEEIQRIVDHNNKKLNKELKAVFREHTEFFELWHKIFKLLSPSAHTTKFEPASIFEEVCTTVSAIDDAIQASTIAKKP